MFFENRLDGVNLFFDKGLYTLPDFADVFGDLKTHGASGGIDGHGSRPGRSMGRRGRIRQALMSAFC